MKDGDRDHGEYVRRVQEGTLRYTHGLLVENERLRAHVAALETEREKLSEEAGSAARALAAHDAVRAQVAALEAERAILREQLSALREQGERQQRRQVELEARLQHVEDENRRFSQEYLEVELQNSNLANLYVANYRLHGTLDRAEVIVAIQEIISNLVGSEEMAIFELDAAGRALTLVGSFGIDPERFREIALGAGIIGRSAARGEPFLRAPGGGEDQPAAPESELTACVPLMLEGRVTGLIALFRLLSHKPGFEAVDHEIFDLLASQAAIALYCTRLHAVYGASDQQARLAAARARDATCA